MDKSKSKIVVDVGASDGGLSKHILSRTTNTRVFAIEPNIEQNFEQLGILELEFQKRFKWCRMAVSEKSGSAKLYGANSFKGLAGSLNQFNVEKVWDQSLSSHFNSETIKDFKIIKVESVSKFIEDNEITNIEFLKIDAQGSDVVILDLFLREVPVNCAVIEVNSSEISTENAYLSDNTFEYLIEVCKRYSLKIIKIIPATTDLSEYNVIVGKDVEFCLKLIEEFHLSESIAIGRFWKVLGLGTGQKQDQSTHKLLHKKIRQGIKHPITSCRSVVFKLTR
jgi:FkbM family methyltransferase